MVVRCTSLNINTELGKGRCSHSAAFAVSLFVFFFAYPRYRRNGFASHILPKEVGQTTTPHRQGAPTSPLCTCTGTHPPPPPPPLRTHTPVSSSSSPPPPPPHKHKRIHCGGVAPPEGAKDAKTPRRLVAEPQRLNQRREPPRTAPATAARRISVLR